MPICAQCGENAGARARFCPACGAPLAAEEPEHEGRKVVTALFCDVTGSTALGERLDPESMRRIMNRYFDEMRAALEAHGGTVEKFIGDAVMAVFGVPVVHEDDALRALRAALEMRRRLDGLNAELERDFGIRLESRIGVNTGEVVVGDGEALATGDAVNVAARLEGAAGAGEILIGDATRKLVRATAELEAVRPLELKGKTEPVPAWRLLSVADPERRHDAPMVGRARELLLLREAFERAAGSRACHLFTVLGSAGVGKSRLLAELLAAVEGDAHVLQGRCLPYGDGITYWPLAAIVREAAGIADGLPLDEARARIAGLVADERDAALIAERVGAAIGLGGTAAGAEETAWAARKLLEALAAERPLVVVFDDVHWAEPTFLDLIEHVAEWTRDRPMLLVTIGRPELLDARPTWAGGKLNATSILLESLTDEETEALIEQRLGTPRLAPELRRRIVESAGGNPLFVEEMLAMLLDLHVAEVEVPPTIQALLAARLDQLPAAERRMLERAAIVGQEFSRGALEELGGDISQLGRLVRKELIRPVTSPFAGDDAYRFRHILIRDAAYAALPKEARAELHERFAGWLERSTGDRLQEYEEILGYHLEQAHQHRAELGPLDAHGRELARAASERLAAAGLRALLRRDGHAAASLLDRALALRELGDPARVPILIALGKSLYDTADMPRALECLAAAEGTADRAQALEARLIAAEIRAHVDPEYDVEELAREAEAAIPELARLDAPSALAAAYRALVTHKVMVLQTDGLTEAAIGMRDHALRAGAPLEAQEAQFWLLVGLWTGPMPIDEGIALGEEMAAHADGLFAQAGVANILGLLHGFNRTSPSRAS